MSFHGVNIYVGIRKSFGTQPTFWFDELERAVNQVFALLFMEKVQSKLKNMCEVTEVKE